MPPLLRHPFVPAAVLVARGPDALVFLQGQFTQELRSLRPRGAGGTEADSTYGLWLNAKGKVVADSVILALDKDSFLLVSEFCPASVIRERLEAYLIADEVELADETGAWEAAWVFPDERRVIPVGSLLGAGEATESAGDPQGVAGAGVLSFGGGAAESGAFAVRVPGPVPRVLRLWRRGGGAEPVKQAGQLEFGGDTLYSVFRYNANLPAIPRELGPGDLPQEAGLEAWAVSFTKGCYLGQEVMARLHSMGKVRRRLVTVRGSGAVPAVGAAVVCGGKTAGDLRGACAAPEGGWVGLAMLSWHLLSAGEPCYCEGEAVTFTWPAD